MLHFSYTRGMNTILDFKNEFRLRSTDLWEDVKEAWFEAVGQMNKRGLPIPPEWQYEPAPCRPDGSAHDGTEPDSPWHEMFAGFDDATIEKLAHILTRYALYIGTKQDVQEMNFEDYL